MWSSERRDVEDKMTDLDDLIEHRDRAAQELNQATLAWLAEPNNQSLYKKYLLAYGKEQLAQKRVQEEGISE